MSDDWLAGLKAGDEVAVRLEKRGRDKTSQWKLGTIVARTARFLIVDSNGWEMLFNAETGTPREAGFTGNRQLFPVTGELRAELEAGTLREQIQKFDLSRVPVDNLRMALELLKGEQ